MIFENIPSGNMSFRSFFDMPNLPLSGALLCALDALDEAGSETDRYTITTGHGSRSFERKIGRIYSKEEIIEEVRSDTFDKIGPGIMVSVMHGATEQLIHVTPPHPRSPFQSFGVGSSPGLDVRHFRGLARAVSKLGNLGFAAASEGKYTVWQRCAEIMPYERRYGPNPGFRIVKLERHAPLRSEDRFDISKNPGRISSVNKMPVFVAADMWLGPAFWKYAPCTKEEVLKEPWLEVEDTEHYLYVKAYPEPFTRPDGEQGRIQKRLWNVLFHQDCEWPPGSGGIADG